MVNFELWIREELSEINARFLQNLFEAIRLTKSLEQILKATWLWIFKAGCDRSDYLRHIWRGVRVTLHVSLNSIKPVTQSVVCVETAIHQIRVRHTL